MLNIVVAPKISAICEMVSIDRGVVGKKAFGRGGEHSGTYSFLPEIGAYSDKIARQNINLEEFLKI